MQRVERTPDDYLASLTGELAADMRALDRLVTSRLVGRSRSLWEGVFWGGTDQTIIGYGDLVQRRPRGASVQWFVVGLARQSTSYSLYVNAVDDGGYLVGQYAGRLGKAKVGSAAISFASPDSINLDVLAELLDRAHTLCPPDGE